MTPPVLRPLTLGEILDVAFGLYRSLFLPLLVVTLVTSALPVVLSVYIESAGGALLNLPMYFLNLLLNAVLGAIASAAATFVVSDSYMGRAISARDAFARATPFIGRLIVLGVLMSLVIGIGLVCVIIPGVILFTGLALSTPALVIEELPSANAAMGRSWALTRGFRGKLFWVLLTVLVLILLPTIALGGFAAASGDATLLEPTVSPATLGWLVAASLIQLLIYPLFYCVLTVAYYDLRVRKEAFDLEVLASGLSPA
ncbi:MAG: hypothetical protein IPI92_07140 [Gemmatimonadetes bacterium]|nr:hypothetical protein [Gemmatimonadota bacterium]MBK7784248.1 hypothetical protein [Gemmatimonadota bacterium]MBK9067706.1 hypothetical protein [Gemmatimonadota bacterium]